MIRGTVKTLCKERRKGGGAKHVHCSVNMNEVSQDYTERDELYRVLLNDLDIFRLYFAQYGLACCDDDGDCVECLDDDNCEGSNEYCYIGDCIECLNDEECPDGDRCE